MHRYHFFISILFVGFVILHRVDGGEVIINPRHVTSLRSPPGPLEGLTPPGLCLVGLTDGKFVSVIEPCAEVKTLLENAR